MMDASTAVTFSAWVLSGSAAVPMHAHSGFWQVATKALSRCCTVQGSQQDMTHACAVLWKARLTVSLFDQ